MMGIRVKRTRLQVYILSSLTISVAIIVFDVKILSCFGLHAQQLPLDAVTAAVIGGPLATGGVGNIIGTLFGVMTNGIIHMLIGISVHAVRKGGYLIGDSVLVSGAGCIGLSTAITLRQFGALGVMIAEPNRERGELARSTGFDVLDPQKDIITQVYAWTHGNGAEFVIPMRRSPTGYRYTSRCGENQRRHRNSCGV